jgi:hypothetical protein
MGTYYGYIKSNFFIRVAYLLDMLFYYILYYIISGYEQAFLNKVRRQNA